MQYEQHFSEVSAKNGLDGWHVDYRRIIYRVFRFWYLIILSVFVAVLAAFLYNRYSTRIYNVSASVIVKSADDMSGSEMLYNNPLVSFKRNYLNETYIIKSNPLIQAVIEDLNFDVAFYREGSILTTEAYDDLPFDAYADRTYSMKRRDFIFKLVDEQRYQLEVLEGENPQTQQFLFGDTVTFDDFKGVFYRKTNVKLNDLIGAPFIFSYSPSSLLTKSYVESLSAQWAEEGAGVINLSINGPSQRKAIDFINGLIEQYQEYDLNNKNQAASRTVDFISDQLKGISDSLRLVERQLQRFKDENVVTDLSGEALRLLEKIEGYESEKAELMMSKNYYRYLIDYVQRNENLDQIILPSSIGITDPILGNLISKMAEMQIEIKMNGKKENPLVSEAKRRIELIKKDIIESVKNQESTDRIKIEFLEKQISEIERHLGGLPVAQRTLVSIQRNYSLMENLYIFLLEKKSEAAISRASNTSDIKVVNPPHAQGAISPKTRRNYLLAVVIGLILPMFAFLLIELFDNRVQSKEDVDKFTTIPFIGGVGHKKTDNNLAVFNHPRTSIAESFRAIRSNLNYFVGKREQAVILITSSISGEGKSFASINLASVLALTGKRTVIIGADMRKPKLFDDFGLKNDVGLSTYLAGLKPSEAVFQRTGYDNLDLVSGGPIPPNPSELLLSSRMKAFLDEAKSQYEYVIIDTPPLAIVTDALVLSPFADHTLFIVRQNYTPKQLLRTADDFFVTGKLKNISIVLNDINKTGRGYGSTYGGYVHGYGYGDGYGYYSEA